MDKLDIFFKALPIITGIGGYSIRNVRADKEKKELQKQLQDKDERIKANEQYEKIINKREVLEDFFTDLLCIDDNCNSNERKRYFLKVNQRYTALYNQIEDFCNKLFDGAINSESYIKETVLPILSELAIKQVEMFKDLNEYADKYGFEKIKQPDYKAFDKYDQFLIKYNGGEGGHFWRNLKNKRRDSGFE